MEPGSVSSFNPDTKRVVTHAGMLSAWAIIIHDKNFQGVIRGGQCTNIVYRGNRNDSCKRIIGILGYLFLSRTIINGNGKKIQIWVATINRKGIIESVINCPIVVLFN